MRCAHCGVVVSLDLKPCVTYPSEHYQTTRLGFELAHGFCPACHKIIVLLREGKCTWIDQTPELTDILKENVIFPTFPNRPISPDVPQEYRDAFHEANSVVHVSPKASAALSRRLLQKTLRAEYAIVLQDLAKEIEAFIQRPDIPSHLSQVVDAIRNIGNFATHPLKYTNTNEIVDVEPGEAEWLIEVLDELFDVTFVQRKRTQARKDELNKKLAALGKPR